MRNFAKPAQLRRLGLSFVALPLGGRRWMNKSRERVREMQNFLNATNGQPGLAPGENEGRCTVAIFGIVRGGAKRSVTHEFLVKSPAQTKLSSLLGFAQDLVEAKEFELLNAACGCRVSSTWVAMNDGLEAKQAQKREVSTDQPIFVPLSLLSQE